MYKLHVSQIVHDNRLYSLARPQPIATFTFATPEALTAAYELLIVTKADDVVVRAEVGVTVTETRLQFVEKSLEDLKRIR